MRKIFLIALKDLKLAFRDRAAIIFMLLAPFLLTIGMGFVTGRFSGNDYSSISDIGVIIVDEDQNKLSEALIEVIQSEDLDELLEPSLMTDLSAAQKLVDDNEKDVVIFIPDGFTESIIPTMGQAYSENVVELELYVNPTSPTSVGVVKTILEQFLSQVETARVGGEVVVTQLLTNGIIEISQAEAVGLSIGEDQAALEGTSSSIKLKQVTSTGEDVKFDILAYLAPGMALMFLMFTVTYGGRSLLVEQTLGTLPRLLISPTSTAQVMAGKVFGIVLTGMAQMLILILGTSLMFQLDWGNPFALLALVLAAVLGATGWGIFLTSIFKTPGQASAIGSAVMLFFGMLGGSFMDISVMPEWVQFLSYITPNRWGLDGFTTLAMGGGFSNILHPILGLLVMTVILFIAAVFFFTRRGLGKQ